MSVPVDIPKYKGVEHPVTVQVMNDSNLDQHRLSCSDLSVAMLHSFTLKTDC